jgi:hypothetical protein
VGEEFKRFTAKKLPGDEEPQQDAPVISAKDLLRGRTKI